LKVKKVTKPAKQLLQLFCFVPKTGVSLPFEVAVGRRFKDIFYKVAFRLWLNVQNSSKPYHGDGVVINRTGKPGRTQQVVPKKLYLK